MENSSYQFSLMNSNLYTNSKSLNSDNVKLFYKYIGKQK